MADLQALTGMFSKAALDADLPLPPGLCAHHGGSTDKRFSIYRNNIVSSLIGAIESQFPATNRLLGEEYFRALARLYVTTEPPSSPVLAHYGDGFPPFIAAFPPLAHLPFLADVARIDRAQVRAYHAADAAGLTAEALARLDEKTVGTVRIGIHPSAILVRSPYRAFDIWQANRMGREEGFDPRGAQATLVVRPGLEVATACLAPEAAALFEIFAQPQSLADALGTMAAQGFGDGGQGAALGELVALQALVIDEGR